MTKTTMHRRASAPAKRSTALSLNLPPATLAVLAALAGWKGLLK
jgi:hypothetical protein